MSDLFLTTSQSSAKFYIVFMPKAETKIPTFKTRNLNDKTAARPKRNSSGFKRKTLNYYALVCFYYVGRHD